MTNLLFEEGFIFAYAGGHLFCLDADSGHVCWENKLVGLGYGACIIAIENPNASLIANQLQQAQQASVSAAVVASSAAVAGSSGSGE
ncbi:hypothetical protein [Alteromonas gilva]|uniref:PQQ-binding-like beta-propeller repeat protein n=1 Tax=Alteromonas gilva TaxID=2987522 RepID=A0ABT5L3E1_9ALTE|nr:hypothetical protein [Alteromonas gilva]MDC8831550.1 hypothetical protein [Alteromonas gilva]